MPNENGLFTSDEVEALKTQLQQEAEAARKESVDEKDRSIAELQASVTELPGLKQMLKERTAEVENLKTSLSATAGRYRAMVIAANPAVPEELVLGDSVEEVDASLEKARTLVDRVRAIQSRPQAAPAPAGAPPRGGPEVETLSAAEKIKYGLRGK